MEDENYNFQILFFPKPLINSVPNECINPPPPKKKNTFPIKIPSYMNAVKEKSNQVLYFKKCGSNFLQKYLPCTKIEIHETIMEQK